MIWRIIYNSIAVPLLWAGFHLYALVSAKARRAFAGRAGLFDQLEAQMRNIPAGARRVWFHSSSMGEFEQAKPIIAELKVRHPEIAVIVSFFSPSGFEHSRTYKLASAITYIPFDSYRNAGRFVELVSPAAAVIVRYDVWPNHLWALNRHHVPTMIASATLRPTTPRSLPVAQAFHNYLYNGLTAILTVSDEDRTVFASFDVARPELAVVGDTRYDQVLRRSQESRQRRFLPDHVVRGRTVLVAGSSWAEDERLLVPAILRSIREDANLLAVIVPHEPTIEHLEALEDQLGTMSIRLSSIADYANERVIVVDSVGILMGLYQYAAVAYVGGGFGGGVHNVLEPAAYGIPVLCGPRCDNSQEAERLMHRGGLFVGRDETELYRHLRRLLTDEAGRKAAGNTARLFVESNTGATERILSYLEKLL
jgi:3-deoxy-D-manno-octulosonic-acid transferase